MLVVPLAVVVVGTVVVAAAGVAAIGLRQLARQPPPLVENEIIAETTIYI